MVLTRLGSGSRDALGRTKSASVRDALTEARTLLASDRPKNPLPSQQLTVLVWRLGQALCGRPGLGPFLLRRLVQVADAVWVRGVIGAELPPQVVCGPGVRLPHAGRGIILHPSCVIGADAVLYHRVTIGMTSTEPAPRLGDGVFVGTGASILGTIRVADGTRVGAHAVLLQDTEPAQTYVGVPARRVVR